LEEGNRQRGERRLKFHNADQIDRGPLHWNVFKSYVKLQVRTSTHSNRRISSKPGPSHKQNTEGLDQSYH